MGHVRSQSESAAGDRSHFTDHVFFSDCSDVSLRCKLGTFLDCGMMGFVRGRGQGVGVYNGVESEVTHARAGAAVGPRGRGHAKCGKA